MSCSSCVAVGLVAWWGVVEDGAVLLAGGLE